MAAAVVAAPVAGCINPGGHPPWSATGVVISVDGPDAATVERFTLRDNDGQVLSFRVAVLDLRNGGLPAPHLREHLVSGDPIQVFYYEDRDGPYVTRYMDAPRSDAT